LPPHAHGVEESLGVNGIGKINVHEKDNGSDSTSSSDEDEFEKYREFDFSERYYNVALIVLHVLY
jgi:hypothetical protein